MVLRKFVQCSNMNWQHVSLQFAGKFLTKHCARNKCGRWNHTSGLDSWKLLVLPTWSKKLLQKGKFPEMQRVLRDAVVRWVPKGKTHLHLFDSITRFSKYGRSWGCVRKHQPISGKIVQSHMPAILKRTISGYISKWRKPTKQKRLITMQFWTSEKR